MKIILNKVKFLNNLKKANLIVGNNLNMNPNLNSILLSVENNQIEYVCTNGQSNLKLKQDDGFEIIEEGKILCRPRIMISVISKLKEKDLEICKVDNSIIRIKTDSFECQVNILDETIYPIMNFDYSDFNKVTFRMQELEEVISKVSGNVFQNTEVSKPLNAIHFESSESNDSIEVIATDGFKVSKLTLDKKEQPLNLLIEPNMIKTVKSIMEDQEIEILFKNNMIIFKDSVSVVTYRIIDGSFPNVHSAFKHPTITSFVLDKKIIIDALDRGSSFVSGEKSPFAKLLLGNKKADIKFESYEFGNSEEQIEIKTLEGESLEINLNAHFLIFLLRTFENDEIEFNFSGKSKPLVLRDLRDKSFVQLMLPTRF